MESTDVHSSGYVDSVMASDLHPKSDDGMINGPLVQDFAVCYRDGLGTGQGPPYAPPSRGIQIEQQLQSDAVGPSSFEIDHRAIHVPLRTSSNTPAANRQRLSMQRRLSSDMSTHSLLSSSESKQSRWTSASPIPYKFSRTNSGPLSHSPSKIRSSADSVLSFETSSPSIATKELAPLQQVNGTGDAERLSPLFEDDPKSFDLVAPAIDGYDHYSLEDRSEQLFSRSHLEAIFKDTASLLRFTSFLSVARPDSVPTLVYYLDALKALRAIAYANAVAEGLDPIAGLEFTHTPARATINSVLEDKADQAFETLVRNDLPAFITHVFTQIVSVSIAKRVTGTLPPLLKEASEGLAEVFCLSDPSRPDNPIVFASEEFHRTTQYGVNYAIGRNCRFLQGPKTNRSSTARFKEAVVAGKEHSEVFLNYRRDGSPFMNLLMIAPLLDSRGQLRYFIGAQIDVSGLVKDNSDLDAFQRLLDEQEGREEPIEPKDEFRELSEMFNTTELETVRRFGGHMHRAHLQDQDTPNVPVRPRLLIEDQSTIDVEQAERPPSKPEGRLSGPYKHYLLIRPAPSLRILFTSPSLRVPGIMQSPFLERIGGNTRIRSHLADALSDGSRGVTAKIRWLAHAVKDLDNSVEEGRPRWIHCTPLLGQSGSVGVWMVILIDDEKHAPVRRFRQAPPVSNDVRSRKENGFASRRDDFETDAPPPPRRATPAGSVKSANGTTSDYAEEGLGGYRTNSPTGTRSIMSEQRALRSPVVSLRAFQSGRASSMDSYQL